MTVSKKTEPEQRPAPIVTLRPLALSDAPRVRRWMADPSIFRFTVLVPGPEYGPVVAYTPEQADKYLAALVRDPDRRSFAIEADGEHVGNVGLKDWHPDEAVAECFIEVGAPHARRRGVARRAMRTLIDLAFEELRLETIRLGVFEFNHQAIALYRRLGFVDDGRYGVHWADDRYWRVNAMRLDEFAWQRIRTSV